MNYISQGEQGLKHISLLRRVFLKKLTGKLHIQFAAGKEEVLRFHEGSFTAGTRPMMPILCRFLTEPVQRFAWEENATMDLKYGRILPWMVQH